ncbi:MAG: hypothetical protein ACI4V7_07245 [Succinivibrionaceae bacterium]
MGTELLELNTDILGRLVESPEASQNFIESILNDLPDSAVSCVSNVVVGELDSSKVAGKAASNYKNINGVIFGFNADEQPAELTLVMEPVHYVKWWHDKSFFSDKFFRLHCNANDGIKRFIVFVVTDVSIKANKFHSISYFNNKNGERNETLQIHDIYAIKESGNEDSMLENWIRALVTQNQTTEETDSNNVSSISDAKKYKVA